MSALSEWEAKADPHGEDHALAEMAIESLKCCGNCDQWAYEMHRSNEFMHCKHYANWQESVDPGDKCHFYPSLWRECAD